MTRSQAKKFLADKDSSPNEVSNVKMEGIDRPAEPRKQSVKVTSEQVTTPTDKDNTAVGSLTQDLALGKPEIMEIDYEPSRIDKSMLHSERLPSDTPIPDDEPHEDELLSNIAPAWK
ncbi:unnamed protein product [Arabis nemorensis]|uniref:Uncharacterized protein n=1 Tax=Arabis nemorensis TaxID=586526 RepID=A0A565ATE2_9BRAS|nr:unnamed protein product [Arabis nemorensis]